MKFLEIITEEYLTTFSTWSGNECHLYKNPSRKELKALIQYDDVRALINGNDLIAWNPMEALHYSVMTQLNLKDAIPVVMQFDGRSVWLTVTDGTENGKWWHNPEVASAIEKNQYIKRNFTKIEIFFYDEAIYGDWREFSGNGDELVPDRDQ